MTVGSCACKLATAIYSVSGNVLTITPNAGFTGWFDVEIVASDGAMTTKLTFLVTVR